MTKTLRRRENPVAYAETGYIDTRRRAQLSPFGIRVSMPDGRTVIRDGLCCPILKRSDLWGYLYDSAMFLPMLISPLSIRRLNPQSGLLQTQAL